jgi:hypothetical protein
MMLYLSEHLNVEFRIAVATVSETDGCNQVHSFQACYKLVVTSSLRGRCS